MNQSSYDPLRAMRTATPQQVERDVRALAAMLNRRRRLRLTVRALWIGLAVAALGLALRLVVPNLGWPLIVFPAAFVCAAVTIRAWFSRPPLTSLVRGYDHHFQLREVLATGFEVARQAQKEEGSYGPLAQSLVEQTLMALAAVRRQVAARSLIPRRELELLLAMALVCLGLTIAGRGRDLPDVSEATIPPLPSPAATATAQPTEPTDEPVQSEMQTPPEQLSPEDAAVAEALADALRDNGSTRRAADALDRGASGEAASEVRELADQVDQLSEGARHDLAGDLSGAAEQLRPTQPDRASRIDQQASQLRGAPQDAAAGLDDLASLIDELGEESPDVAEGGAGQEGNGEQGTGDGGGTGTGAGENGGGGGAGSGLGGESRGLPTDPPQAGGEVMPLPPMNEDDAPMTSATGPEGPQLELEAGGTGNAAREMAPSGAGADTPIASEADPLRIPPEYRDVVENYFSPPDE